MSPGAGAPHSQGVLEAEKDPQRGWSQNQLLAPSAVKQWVRLAAAGRAQQSRRGSLHLRSGWTPGTWAPRAHCPGWLGRGSARLQGWGARMVGSGDCRYLISSSGVTQLCSRAHLGPLTSFAALPLRYCDRWPARQPHILAVREEDLG